MANSKEENIIKRKHIESSCCENNKKIKEDEFQIFKEKLEKSIQFHCDRCEKDSSYNTFPKLQGPIDQFVQKAKEEYNVDDPHPHWLLPCRRHSYCEKCLFERYKEDKNYNLYLGEEIPYELSEEWIWLPPPEKRLFDNENSKVPNYPDCLLYSTEIVATFGMVKVNSKKTAIEFVKKHGLPLDRLDQTPDSFAFVKTYPFALIFFY